jgi:malate/lactate dehydrogenase
MKIGIVGCGMVGSTRACALVMSGVAGQGALATIPLPLSSLEEQGLRRRCRPLARGD